LHGFVEKAIPVNTASPGFINVPLFLYLETTNQIIKNGLPVQIWPTDDLRAVLIHRIPNAKDPPAEYTVSFYGEDVVPIVDVQLNRYAISEIRDRSLLLSRRTSNDLVWVDKLRGEVHFEW